MPKMLPGVVQSLCNPSSVDLFFIFTDFGRRRASYTCKLYFGVLSTNSAYSISEKNRCWARFHEVPDLGRKIVKRRHENRGEASQTSFSIWGAKSSHEDTKQGEMSKDNVLRLGAKNREAKRESKARGARTRFSAWDANSPGGEGKQGEGR